MKPYFCVPAEALAKAGVPPVFGEGGPASRSFSEAWRASRSFSED